MESFSRPQKAAKVASATDAGARPARILLLASVFVVAACGLVYELVAGAVGSYLMGDAVTQFSLVIGVFLSAMGLGSFLAQYKTTRLLKTFVELEIWIGLFGGMSSILLFAVSAVARPAFPVVFFSLCAFVGALIGAEIPLLIRVLKDNQPVSRALSHVLALDYLGALAGALIFPLVVLPFLGLSRASAVFGILNLIVAGVGITLLPKPRRFISIRLGVAALVLLFGLGFSTRLVGFFEDLLYQDSIVFTETTPYQRIVLTRWRDDTRLYLNGGIQFSTVDEARYHEPLVIAPLEAAGAPRDVLILGGGDGLAAREVLKYPGIRTVTIVDIDPAVTRLAVTRQELVAVNKGSLQDSRVTVKNEDAFLFLEQTQNFYDAILVDLPDPVSSTLCKLYSDSFYALCLRRLRPQGVLMTQATSPYYAPMAFFCVLETVKAAVARTARPMEVFPLHVNVPSFGEWGFVMAAPPGTDPDTLAPSVPTRFLTPKTLRALFALGKDLTPPRPPKINTLEDPVLSRYYQRGWKHFND